VHTLHGFHIRIACCMSTRVFHVIVADLVAIRKMAASSTSTWRTLGGDHKVVVKNMQEYWFSGLVTTYQRS